jgi:O-antigen ligase
VWADIGRSGTVVGAISLAQYLINFQLPGGVDASVVTLQISRLAESRRFAGPVGDYELFALFLSITGVTQLFFALSTRGQARFRWWAQLSLTIFLLFATGTRAGVLSLAAGGVLLVLTRAVPFRRSVRWVAAALLGLPIMLPLIARADGQSNLLMRLQQAATGDRSLAGLLDRRAIWDQFNAAVGHNWISLFGHGPRYPYAELGFFPHSQWLYVLYTMGAVGATVFALQYLLTIRSCLRKWAAPDRIPRLAMVVLLLLAANSLKIELSRFLHTELIFWTVIGAACGAAPVLMPSRESIRSRQ